jgi:hypothetical protein
MLVFSAGGNSGTGKTAFDKKETMIVDVQALNQLKEAFTKILEKGKNDNGMRLGAYPKEALKNTAYGPAEVKEFCIQAEKYQSKYGKECFANCLAIYLAEIVGREQSMDFFLPVGRYGIWGFNTVNGNVWIER